MLSTADIKQLKQVNISRDTAKTKERIKEAYDAGTRAEKQSMIELSGQNRNSFYRAERTGNASAKIIMPVAQVMNVSPYWLMGVADEKGEYSQELEIAVLKELGYGKLLDSLGAQEKKPARRKRAPKQAETVETPVEPAPVEEPEEALNMPTITIVNTPEMRDAVDTLGLEDATKLLAALYLRAKAGGKAKQLCETVKYCLLS